MGTFMSKFSQASARFTKAGESNLHNNGKPDPKSKNEKDDFKYESDAGGYELILSPTKPGGNIVKTGMTFGGDNIKVGRDAEGQGAGRDSNYYRGIVTKNLGGQYNLVKGVKSREETPQEKADRIKDEKKLSGKG
tara:strand:+ start:6991 stop:7395 length:405 start_codon:yes stop_codon:yes gene_type:complete